MCRWLEYTNEIISLFLSGNKFPRTGYSLVSHSTCPKSYTGTRGR
eukprot:SAG11_NODE_21080_length_432_cov_1.432432_1_plen_44_part_10